MNHNKPHELGNTGLQVTAMGFGAAPIGNIFQEISESESEAMISNAWDAGIRYFDTAPMYGHGLSEARCGYSLRWKPRNDFVLSTKVGRILTPQDRSKIEYSPWINGLPFKMQFDYSYDGTIRSIEDSLQRLGLERIDIAFIHDIDNFTHGPEMQKVHFKEAMNGAWKALENLRDEGVIKAIGVGVNEWEVCYESLKLHDFDCFLLAGRYTLIDQNALDIFLPLCQERNVDVIIGGCYNSGILATGSRKRAKYNYSPAPKSIIEKVSKLEIVCSEYSVPLPAAALQFVLAHPSVPTVIPGTRTKEQLRQNIEWLNYPIPAGFWEELKYRKLINPEAPTPV